MGQEGGVDNDTRGWIMAIVSGIACVAGASIICVDTIVRLIPSQKNFRIEESNGFLASSLSLSFGVMIFSALSSMLPSSKRYLEKDLWGEQAAGFIMTSFWVAGFMGIQIVSRFLHQFMPSHVVDCDHTHQEASEDEFGRSRSRAHSHVHSHFNSRPHSPGQSRMSRSLTRSFREMSSQSPGAPRPASRANGSINELTPLMGIPSELQKSHTQNEAMGHTQAPVESGRHRAATQHASGSGDKFRRRSVIQLQKNVLSFVKDTKTNCDEFGPCYGYSDPCGQECFKHLSTRSALSRAPTMLRTTTGATHRGNEAEEGSSFSPYRTSRAQSRDNLHSQQHEDASEVAVVQEEGYLSLDEDDVEAQHHHHVATNAFMAIGLQTVIAIALHKFPEGFITYATNHASPKLGFNVFMALFVHNIAEGFSMALPLYMALGSRFKAILWSSLLGGFSQPMGAALAVLWFKLANQSNLHIDNTAYACLFAATAGIMTSVALQLFVESLSLNHNRNMSIFFAFIGMTLLGISNALVNDHDH